MSKEIGETPRTLSNCACRSLQRMGRFLGESRSTDARMVEKKKAPKRLLKSPLGDRRQFLTMMSPDIIKSIKQAAMEDDRAAWDVMEEAARQWLERRKSGRKS